MAPPIRCISPHTRSRAAARRLVGSSHQPTKRSTARSAGRLFSGLSKLSDGSSIELWTKSPSHDSARSAATNPRERSAVKDEVLFTVTQYLPACNAFLAVHSAIRSRLIALRLNVNRPQLSP